MRQTNRNTIKTYKVINGPGGIKWADHAEFEIVSRSREYKHIRIANCSKKAIIIYTSTKDTTFHYQLQRSYDSEEPNSIAIPYSSNNDETELVYCIGPYRSESDNPEISSTYHNIKLKMIGPGKDEL